MEAAHRASLAKGEAGIREKKAAPTLRKYMEEDFLPFDPNHQGPANPTPSASTRTVSRA
jgi:hypothetical protein